MSVTSLSLRSEETNDRKETSTRRTWAARVLLGVLLLVLAGAAFVGYEIRQRLDALDAQLANLSARSDQWAALVQRALQRATAAESQARASAEGRQLAEAQTAAAREQADAARQESETARHDATTARETAARAQAEADRVRKQAEDEINRLEAALGQIAETRRTALGLVMNLGSDHLKFEFDKAELRAEDRELLSRILGILMTSHDYTVSVNGHTDDVGTDAYNQKLSERRAQAVRDFLVTSGLSPDILTVQGHGKSMPLVPGTSDAARAKNRRVELGIVNTQIRFRR
jgi:outer membrane protein OmpA-like peptidoglycan-associated protein